MVKVTKIRRNSRQRQVILEELRKQKDHPTAAILYRIVRRRLPKISLGTVYRNLEILARDGLINRLTADGAAARYDGDVEKHYHIRCKQCGKYDDLYDFSLGSAVKSKKRIKGYLILGHHFEFLGLCPQCQRSNKNLKIKNNKQLNRR